MPMINKRPIKKSLYVVDLNIVEFDLFGKVIKFEITKINFVLLNQVSLSHSEVLWPWSGWLGVSVAVAREAQVWTGTAQGHIELTVESPPEEGESQPRTSTIKLAIRANIIPTPPRQ